MEGLVQLLHLSEHYQLAKRTFLVILFRLYHDTHIHIIYYITFGTNPTYLKLHFYLIHLEVSLFLVKKKI